MMKTLKNNTPLRGIFLILLVFTIQSCRFKGTESSAVKDNVYNFVQVATGQVSLYDEDGDVIKAVVPGDSLFGQDANYLTGKKMSFEKNGDGTVADLNTGLVWQEIPTSEGFDWQGAYEYCENLELGGYHDWRMPTVKELFSISDFSSGWPYLDTNHFSLVNNENPDKSEQYWSSNKYVGHTEEGGFHAAFGVNHVTGHIKAYRAEAGIGEKAHKGPPEGHQPPPGQGPPPGNGGKPMGNPLFKHVRAVRGSIYGTNDFQDNKNGTITDKATGLMWSKNDSGKGLNWESALSYAENSELAGYSDWRLPNVKELQSIVDYSFAPNAKNPKQVGPSIDPMFSCSEISNENGDKDYPYYWTGTSARFQKGKPYYYAWYVAFGRAVNKEGLDFHGAGAVRFDAKHEDGPASEGGERYYNYVRLLRNVD
ncbi:Lcl C-terminal domain-containing protein [Saccharicrinis sp. GN24d3]|uniref:Lcl C-terminal domain-containing protein n=1 Tax=Saccharicrinis sp. GN24d3 TaxID=3458416 RepID=UPI00403622E8